MQLVKSLLQKKRLVQKIDLDKNAKNLEGRTTLDIATTVLNPGEAKREIKEALDHVGALKSTSLPEDYSFAEFFKSPQMSIELFTRLLFYQGRELTMEMRNAILVVAVLIATATFQAILSPPGGVVGGTGDNNNLLSTNENHINATIMSTNTNNNLIPTNNVSYINATIFTNTATTVDPSKLVLFKKTKLFKTTFTYGNFFTFFYFLNTICFLASLTTIIFVLPIQLVSILLYISLFYLMTSYGVSFFVISPSSSYTILFLILSCVFALLIYFMGPLWISIGGNLGVDFPLILVVGHQRKRLQMLLHLLERS
ncbi:hypothetical protein HYC85_027630 [Camellia sinensis]|uniref:PGG domain-containing protein n=1 Tax=Camellia sinensis TaxID=4442 RepID=A0A7J7G9A1_CAMSI|nr:hypothetical protein HYC85_027630 [Camellia sinensis]